MTKLFIPLLFVIALLPAINTYSQDGANDPTFNSSDIGFGYGDGANSTIYTTTLQSDGKIIIGGQFASYDGSAKNFIARLNTDGSLDNTFNVGTGFNNTVLTTAVQSDGKIIIGGFFTSYNGTATNYIVRLNIDGSLDNTFNPGIGFNYYVRTTVIQSNGKIIVGGDFTSYNGTARNHITRLNTDGSIDNTFNPGTGFNSYVFTTAIQKHGKIIIGGDFTSYNGTAKNRIVRLNTDGSLDNTFNVGTGFNGTALTTAIQRDGKIIVGGCFSSYNGTAENRIARLNADGSIDNAFNIGTGFDNPVLTTAIQSDGKIIVGGYFTSCNLTVINRIARLNADGSIDNTFNPGIGFNINSIVYTTPIQIDGKIIVGGYFTNSNGSAKNFIARLNTDGSIDNTFNPGTGFDNPVLTTAIQSDGKIIVGGYFTRYNGAARNYIARLNTDGSLDNTFNSGTEFNSQVYTIAIQSDGKIIIGGAFASYNGSAKNFIARLNTDGSLDNAFNVGTGFNDAALTSVIQSDGKILIGGYFTSYNGTARNFIARLNTDGSIDNTFNHGAGFNWYVFTTAIQSDGKIIVGGEFASYNGTARNHISRLNIDGSIDNTFTPGIGINNYVYTTAIQSDGKILIGGLSTTYNGLAPYLARLNSDGTLDNTFIPGTGFGKSVFTIAIQSDGKIIIGGEFTSYNGTAINNIARLNTDGSLDVDFNVGVGTNNSIRTTTIQSEGKIIIGGEFTAYAGTGRNRIARINNRVSVTNITSYAQAGGLSVFPNPNNGDFTICLNKEETFSLLNNLGQTVQTITLNKGNNNSANITGIESGIYYLVSKSNTQLNYKIVVGR
jgi:uncharacterized delta-60 repeat protein